MKRIIICFTLVLAAVLGLCACNGAVPESESGGGYQIELTYGEKYINVADVGNVANKQDYFIFYEDGTADYHKYLKTTTTYSYTLHYICETVPEENMIFCFYNGVDYDYAHKGGDVSTTARHTLICSENIVMEIDGTTYARESYLATLPNYGK